MTIILCELNDCIHNTNKNKIPVDHCKCDVVCLKKNGTSHFCDSYMKTPEILEEHLKCNCGSTAGCPIHTTRYFEGETNNEN